MGFKWSIQQSTVTEESFQLVSNPSEREMQIPFFSLHYPDFCYKFQLLLLAIQNLKYYYMGPNFPLEVCGTGIETTFPEPNYLNVTQFNL